MATHPPCGLYRTTRALNDVPAGRLVFFHNHGDPGPGVYLPKTWSYNRAEWHERGHTVPDADWSQTLESMPVEGLYSVQSGFFCCSKECTRYEMGQLVQLVRRRGPPDSLRPGVDGEGSYLSRPGVEG